MSELSARLALYVEIDKVAESSQEQLQHVAQVVPLYGRDLDGTSRDDPRQGTLGWRRYLPDVLPDVGADGSIGTIDDLGRLTEPSALDQARRLKALWAASRVGVDGVVDQLAAYVRPLVTTAILERDDGRDSSDDQPRAPDDPAPPPPPAPGGAAPPSPAPPPPAPPGPTGVDDATQQLVQLIAVEPAFATSDQFDALVAQAAQNGLISGPVATLAQVGCDHWDTYVPVTSGGYTDLDPAARIVVKKAGLDIKQQTLADVVTGLDPHNWPNCLSSFWCSMQQVQPPASMAPGPLRWFQEEVGECPVRWFDPYLAFAMVSYPNGTGFELQYDLGAAADLQQLSVGKATALVQDANVEADCGKIIVNFHAGAGANGGNLIDVTTSKTIRFKAPMPTGGVAIVACACGWADQTRLMMAGCLGLTI